MAWRIRPTIERTDDYEVDLALLTMATTKVGFKHLLKEKVDAAYFHERSHRDMWDWLRDHYEEWGRPPSVTLMREQFPDFSPEYVTDSEEQVIATAKDKRKYSLIQKSLKQISAATTEDPDRGLEVLQEAGVRIAQLFTSGETEDVTQAGDEVKRLYRMNKKRKGLIGYPWPWDRLNKATKGIVKGGFYVFYGRTGVMKTWILLECLEGVHDRTGATPIFFTYEEPVEDIRVRWAVMKCGLDWDVFQDGKLTPRQEKRFFRRLEELKDSPPFVVTELEGTGQSGIVEMRAKAEEAGAKVIGIDGLSFTVDDLEWQTFASTMQSIKTFARKSRIPTIATHHANRERGKKTTANDDSKDVALGDALSRYVDGLFRLSMTPENRDAKEIHLGTPKTRRGKPCQFVMNAKPAYDFKQKAVHDEEDEGGMGAGDDEAA